MDQVRTIAKVIWQQRFWVLSVLATCIAVACWYLAAGNLQTLFTKRLSEINGQFSSVKSINNEPFHPNDEVIKGDLEQAVKQRESVYQVWTDLYERQHTEVLNWPESLGEEFLETMKGRKFREYISPEMRDQYWNYIKLRFDGLLEIVQARKIEGQSGRSRGGGRTFGGEYGGMGGGFAGAARASRDPLDEEEDYLVEWLDQGDLEVQLSFKKMPSADQIWVTQEDLWVYETLLHVIAKTNQQRHATRPDNTAVREILQLQVGRPAIRTSTPPGRIYIPQADSTGQGSMGEDYGSMGGAFGGETMGGGDRMGGGMGPGGMGEGMDMYGGGDGVSLLAERYLDPEGQPISAESISDEYRLLPVHMELTMDQRWISPLLVECANAPLPVEVKWIRVNAEKARSAVGSTPASGRGRMESRLNRSSNSQGSQADPNLATVEIQGVVLIYGEPDKEILSVPGAEEDGDNQLADASTALSNTQ